MSRWFLLVALTSTSVHAQGLLRLDLDHAPWRYFDGDDPAFARPEFDDSAWPGITTPVRTNDFRWYRTRVTIPPWADTARLSFVAGNLLPVYVIYVDGVEIGRSGSLTSFEGYHPFEPRAFPVPPGLLRPGGTSVIAIRAWSPFLQTPRTMARRDVGMSLVSRELVPADLGAATRAAHWLRFGPALFMSGLFLTLAVLTLVAWRFAPERADLLWFTALCLDWCVEAALPALPVLEIPHYLPNGISLSLLTISAPWISCFALAAARVRRKTPYAAILAAWATLSLVLIFTSGKATFRWLFFGGYLLMEGALFVWVATDTARRWAGQGWGERLLRLTLAARFGFDVVDWIRRIDSIRNGQPTRELISRVEWGPFLVDLDLVMALAVAIALFTVLVLRVGAERDEKRRLAGELEAARGVQQLLVPTGATSGVDAVYLPANEVGGDFWHFSDGRLLVVGDVSGKGLKAAMVVSLITGMLDRRHADSPAELLAELNRALCTRLEGGFVTCCVVRLEADGRLTAANAGHPAPYLDGRELELSPGLPLGIVADAEYTETSLPFAGVLTLVSDGVIEAANASGELFGFDRTRDLSTKSAAEIAEAARAWGQTDDITVVTLRRSVTA